MEVKKIYFSLFSNIRNIKKNVTRESFFTGHDHFCSLHSLIITGAEDRNGVIPNSVTKRVHTNPIVNHIEPEPIPSDVFLLDQEPEESDEDVDNASTYTQHGQTFSRDEFMDDDAGSSLHSAESDH